MSGWIKFEKDLLTDPRVLRIAKTLAARWKLDEVTVAGEGFEIGNAQALPAVTLVCGALVRIWSLADTHIASDNVLPLGFDELNEVVGVPGFCELLPSDWMQEVDANSVELPQYHAHNGTEAKKKAVTQKRVSRYRVRALQGGNGRALPDLDLDLDQDQTKTLKPKSKPLAPNAARSPLKQNGKNGHKVNFDPESGIFTGITEDQELQWQEAFPAVPIPPAIAQAAAWLKANPANRKSNNERFLVNWFSRAQERAGRVRQ